MGVAACADHEAPLVRDTGLVTKLLQTLELLHIVG
jgi:hypothetical protein